MTISRAGNENNRFPIYTFTNGSSSYVFIFTNSSGAGAVSVSVNGGNFSNVPVSLSTDGSGRRIATFNTPYTIVNGNVSIKINYLRKIFTESGSTSDYQDSPNRANVNVVGTINGVVPITRSYDKRKVSLKGPSATNYTTITANTNDIYYPTSGDGFMYSGYAEVTDYVRQNGIGQYTVADIALVEGNGTSVGFYGGWSLVVVYENSKMKYRDVTIFDGHAYVAGNVTAEFELPVSGFNTIQNGPVNMKLGVMAGEGDKNISGDYFQIQKNSDNSWMNLSHSDNAENNFFNSSIFTGGNTRNPNFVNNTGLDISVFNISNPNNSVIANGQTATKFKYGSTQDTYVIFATVMSVDAYVPEIEGILTTTAVNGVAVSNQNPTALPGQEISYNVNVKNLGTEAINNANVIIPIPFNASYVAGSASKETFFNPVPTPNNVTFNPNLGPNGSIVWNIGTLPLPANPNTLLGTLKFRLKTTTDCAILANTSCSDGILVYGSTTGVGAITGIQVKDQPLIRGYQNNGTCMGEPIAIPLIVNINAANFLAQNCGTTTAVKNFPFCNLTGTTVAVSQIAGSFPNGSNFYNEYPVTQNSIQYTSTNPFPAITGTSITYYAVPQNAGDCVFLFKISVCKPIDAVNDNMPSTLGVLGNSNVGNIFANNSNGADMLNGSQVAIGLVNLTVTNPATPVLPLPGTLVPYINLTTGNVVVPVGTLPGNYTITYQICEKANPTNCDTAVVNVPVSITPIDAVNDLMPSTVGALGNTNAGNIFADNGSGIDKLNGLLVNIGLINLTISNTATPLFPGAPVPTINLLNGNVVIPEQTPAGNYQIKYRICENLNSSNCDEAFVTIPVTAAPINAVNDTMTAVNGTSGNTNAGNIFTDNGNGNDTLNGNPVTIAQVNLTVTTGAVPLTPGANIPSIDANGNVVVPVGTPAGSYTITYQICEKLNPANCDSAVVTIPVNAPAIDAVNDTMPAVNGTSGNTNAGNIFTDNGNGNDTLNGNPVTIAQVNLTVTTGAVPLTLGANIPSIDANGNVVVPVGTPAGSYTMTYQICEKLNPANCDSAVVTIPVNAPAIDAVNDTMPAVNGTSGNTNAGNIFTDNGNGNDTLNGNPVTISQVNLTVTTGAVPLTPGANVPSIDANGNVVVPAGTPAGSYTITYQICEKLNPANCDSAVVTIPVNAPAIDAVNDTMTPVNGTSGNDNAGNIFTDNGNGNDTLNGNPVTISQVNLTVTTGAVPLTPGANVPSIDANGNVVVPVGTPAGSYTITYQICEKLNPANCDSAVVTIPVSAPVIDAVNDTMTPVNGTSGNDNAGNVFANNGNGNDTLNGNPVTIAQVNLTVTTGATPLTPGANVPSIDANGNVVVPVGTPAGSYTITYQICEKLNPANCDSAVVTIPVNAPVIDAVNDTMTPVNGTSGNDNAGNVFANNGNGNDTLNGNPVTIAQVNLTVTTGATPLTPGANVPSIDANGNVVVPVGTPAGSYTITYQICEKLNPANCDSAVVTIPVSAPAIDAVNDTMPAVNGTSGNDNAGNVFTNNGNGNDTLNGNPVTIAQVNLTVTTGAVPLTPGANVPSIDANGNVVVPVGTPAGSYTITYQICEKLNPANCDSAVVTIPVSAPAIDAVNDTMPAVNGTSGNDNAGNVFTNNGNGNDTLNGNQVTIAQVNLTVTTGAVPLTPGANVPSIDANGNVVVPVGTPAGSYTITYQICEKLNPANCDSAVVTIPVSAPAIDAVNDTMPAVNGTSGNDNAGNVFTNNGNGNDTLNGNPVTIAQVNLTVTTGAVPLTPGANVPSIDANGNVVVPVGTPAGSYTITYQICEKLNPANCDSAVVTIPVSAPAIDAVNDTMTPVNGTSGNDNAGNVFANNGNGNDTLNGNPVTIAQVNLTVTTGAVPLTPGANIPSIDANGNVVVPVGTPAGSYTITYQICEKLNPANCDSAVVTIPVNAPAIDAVNDTMTAVNGTSGNDNAGNVFANNGNGNDTLNGNPVTIAQVNLTVTTGATPLTPGANVPSIDANGNVVVPVGTPAGSYTITYQICEKLNPANCDSAVVTIPVNAPVIDAVNDTMTPVNGTSGNDNAGNVFANNGNGNDTLNGNPVTIAQVNLTVTTGATPLTPGANVPSIDANGNVVVPVGTPAGSYTITYQICEKLNPANCDSAVVTIPVSAPAIDAVNDTMPAVNGTSGNDNAGNVFTNNGNGNDTLNGNPVTIAQVNLTVTTGAVPLTPGANVPSIDANGNVVVPVGTPAGSYTITYQICEKLNPANCDSAVVTIPVSAPAIDAVNDTMPAVNGTSGNDNAGNVFTNNGNGNDTLNGNQVTIAQVNLTVTTGAVPLTPGANVPSIDANGNVVVPVGTPAGSYTITYQICEKLNPANCDSAVVTIPVSAPAIDAVNDTMPAVNGTSGNDNAGNVFTNNGNGNDTLNGNPVTIAQVNLTVTTGAVPLTPGANVPSIDANGNVVVPVGTPAGSYTITYQICEKLNPANCDSAVVTIPVSAPAIDAVNDTMTPVNGTSGNDNAGNVFANNGNGNDTLNGNPVTIAQVNLTVTTGAVPLTPGANIPSIDANGNVVVPVGTPAGSYTITYQICEKLNPANCDSAVVTIPVNAPAIDAVNDTMTAVNGTSGNDNAGNVFANNGNGNDTLNGNPVTIAQVNLTVTTGAVPLTPGANVPSIDANGNVVVPVGTPAGSYTITYQICEKLNPANCDSAVVTIPVNAPAIDAVNDTMPAVNGTSGNDNAGNVFTNNGNGNDTLNGNPVTIAQVNLTVTTGAVPLTPGANVPSIDANGNVVVPVGTPAGSYTITYQICEKLNPANCDSAVVTIPVNAPAIDAVNDTMTAVNGTSGNDNAGSIFANNGNGNDTLNGNQVTIAQVNLTVTTGAVPLTPGANVPSIDANGNVVVPVGTPAGSYTITYQICEKLNPANCDSAVVTIPVNAPAIDAVNDTMTAVNGTSGNTNAGNVFANNGNGNDTLNGNPVTIAQVNLTVTTGAVPLTPGANIPSIDANGNVVVPAGTPAGSYTITYQICEKLNPANCDSAVVTIPVNAPAIDAVNDTMPAVNGTSGNTNAGNVFANNGNGNDTLNGNPVTISQVNLTVTTGAVPLTPGANIPSIDANGNVVIPAGTPAGSYTITYQICEKLNPANCDSAIVTIPVNAPAIDAVNDTMTAVNGTSGNTNAGNVFANNGNGNDTLNGNPVTISQVNLTVTTGAVPLTPGANVPSIDANGNVVIPAGTPAGSYTITYQICEKLNPANCDSAVVTIPVNVPVIDALNDTMNPVNGTSGNDNAGSIFANNGNGNDTLNGNPVTIAQVNLTVTTGAVPLTPGANVPSIDANGNVVVPIGTPAGSYTITYQICEKLNPANCDSAVVTIPVNAPAIDAVNDTMTAVNGTSGNDNAGSIFANNGNGNDTLNGNQVTIAQVNLTVTTGAVPLTPGANVPSIDANGNVVVPVGTPAGSYTITYQICEKLNPANCDSAVVTIPVNAPAIDAVNDTMTAVNGTSGNTNAGNVFANNGNGNDTLNGNPVTIAQVNLTVTTGAVPLTPGANVPSIDANGNVVVPVGTPAGSYTITYQICEKLNPANCDSAVVTIPVSAPAIDAVNDTMTPVNGTSGNDNAGNVFANNGNGNDTLNGNPVTIAQVNLTVTTGAVPLTPGANVPSIDANGNVVVPVGTPAGSYTITYQICEKLNPANCDSAVVTIPVYTPSIQLLKEGTYVDTNLPTGVSVGDSITYTFTVINNGTVDLTNITVTDPLVTVIGGPITTLAPGASDSTTFSATYVINQADIDAGQVNNLALATGTPPAGNPVTDESSDPNPCTTCEPVVGCPDCTSTELPGNPSINITKDGTYVDANSDGITNIGDTVTYVFTVTNTGNVTLSNVTLTDNNAVVSGGPIAMLNAGASDSTTFTAVHTITQEDIDAGQVNNLALVTGTTPSGTPVTDESSDPTPCTTCSPDPTCLDCTNTPLINAVNDNFIDISCAINGNAGNILTNDTYGTTPVNTSANNQVTLTILSGNNANINIDSNGNISIVSGLAVGSYTITYQICSTTTPNTCDQATVTINIVDTTAPTFVEALPADATVECTAVPTAPTLTAIDSCGTATVTLNTVTNPGTCPGNYTLINTWTATDASGNTSVHIQTITVQDTTAPSFVETLPSDLTVECASVPTVPTLTATDSCGTATVTFAETTTAGTCAGNYILTRTWTATDLCGLETTHVQTITVQDTTAPTFVEALPADATVECASVPTATTLTATDSCGTATVTFTETTTAGTCPGNYILTRTWTATDLCGLTTTHVQTITVQDTTAPTFVETLPTDVTVECNSVPTAPTLTATDSCGTATVTFTEMTTPGTCAGNYTLTRTWTATDLCGLTATHVQTITVQDTTAPSFIETLPSDLTVECASVPTAPTLTATDNCGTAIVTYTEITTAGTCAGNYTLTRTWIATDLCGLETTHVQTITVQDTTAPTFVEVLPADATVECASVPTAPTLTATDSCGTASVTFTETTTAGTCAGNYTLTRTWTATDLCGLTTTHVQTITVQDTTAPSFVETLPTDVTVECASVPTAPTLTATDSCGTATVTFTETTTAGTCAGNYTLTRTWTATDLCGLTTTHVQTITVQDTTAPTFVEALPSDLTVECASVPTVPILTATDSCGTASVAFTETTTAGTCAGNYTLTRTWTATDLCGLTTTHVQTITVQDTTAPSFVETLPSDLTVECASVPTAPTLTATDSCGTASVAFTETTMAGTCAGNYTLTRTWTATDLCGLTATHVQTITVQDTTAPSFVETLPTDVTVECTSVPTAPTLTATDSCGTATVTFTETTTAGNCAGNYTLTRTWTATDLCGLTATHVQTITVQDTTAPTFVETLPADATVSCGAIPTAPTLTATDSCGTATVTFTETIASGACAGDSVLTRTWTATDLCGNTTSHTQVITVEDNVAPITNTVFDAVLNVTCTTINTAPDLQFTDSCSTVENTTFDEAITNQTASGYTIIRTWTATDQCGNVGTASQTINVMIATPVQTISSELCIEDIAVNLFDFLDPTVETNGTWIDTNNSGGLNGSTFNPTQIAVGYYLLSYVIPGGDCPRTIEINMNVNDDCVVLPACTINVHNAMTPNNDGLNDYFQIDGIECYPNNSVEIYNRWGVLVFDAQGYDNATKVFRGISEGRVTVKQDSELPDGTYFYILKYTDAEGQNKEKASYIYLNR